MKPEFVTFDDGIIKLNIKQMLVKISLKPLFMLRLSALPRSKSTKSHSVAIYCPCKLGWDDYNKSTIACNKCND